MRNGDGRAAGMRVFSCCVIRPAHCLTFDPSLKETPDQGRARHFSVFIFTPGYTLTALTTSITAELKWSKWAAWTRRRVGFLLVDCSPLVYFQHRRPDPHLGLKKRKQNVFIKCRCIIQSRIMTSTGPHLPHPLITATSAPAVYSPNPSWLKLTTGLEGLNEIS